MNSLGIVLRRSLQYHYLSFSITTFAIGISFALCLVIFSLQIQSSSIFLMDKIGFNAVLGARGSSFQLVLNSVYHLDTSPGNISWKLYQDIARHPSVESAVPYAVGDNYYGYRIVGTTPELFKSYQDGVKFTKGKAFDPLKNEAVIGITVAQKMKLKLGDIIHPYHGLEFNPSHKHESPYHVVGIMAPTNTPADRVVWIPIDGFFRMEGHVLQGSGTSYTPEAGVSIPDEHKELSSVMLKISNPMMGMMLNQTINRQGKVATLAFPIANEVMIFYEKMGWILIILKGIAIITLIVSSLGMLAAISNTMNERRQEFAILRSLGARRSFLLSALLSQSMLLAIGGIFIGFITYFIAMVGISNWMQSEIGVHFSTFLKDPIFIYLPLFKIILSIFVGLLPALQAYRTDIFSTLQKT